MSNDFLDYDSERRIIESGVREVFTPTQPVSRIDLLFARERILASLIRQINIPGQHSLIFGERGVGKSSLALVLKLVVETQKLKQGKVSIFRCDSDTKFKDIVRLPLLEVGTDVDRVESSTRLMASGSAGLSSPGQFVNVEAGSEFEESETREGPANKVSPGFAANALASHSGILIIDEADVLRGHEEKRRLAEFIKHLSDNRSPYKLVIVGVAETAEELIGQHESVNRCLQQTQVPKMTEGELAPIIFTGSKKIRDLSFDNDVVRAITRMSHGFPYFTHLLALMAAEDAIRNVHRRVVMSRFKESLKAAAKEAEQALANSYAIATRATSSNNIYAEILQAASIIETHQFTKQEIVKAYKRLHNEVLSTDKLTNALQQLAANNNTKVFRRKARNVYQFVDPRMPSFIKIANGILT